MRISLDSQGNPLTELERDWLELEAIMEAREAGERLYRKAGQLLAPELKQLPQEAQNEFWRRMFETAKKHYVPRPQPVQPVRSPLLPPGNDPR